MSNIEVDWIQFSHNCADFQTFRKILHNNKKNSRVWDVLRWKQGINNVLKYLENNLDLNESTNNDDLSDDEEI